MIPKSDTIAAIVRINPTANPEFLAQFSNRELDEYLHRLRQLPTRSRPHGRAHPRQAELVAAIAPHHPA